MTSRINECFNVVMVLVFGNRIELVRAGPEAIEREKECFGGMLCTCSKLKSHFGGRNCSSLRTSLSLASPGNLLSRIHNF